MSKKTWLLTTLVAVIAAVCAFLFWNTGLKHYNSAGA